MKAYETVEIELNAFLTLVKVQVNGHSHVPVVIFLG
jgi:hypothetical protein